MKENILKSIPALLFALLVTVVAVALGISLYWMFSKFHTLSLSNTIFTGTAFGIIGYLGVMVPVILKETKKGCTLLRTTK